MSPSGLVLYGSGGGATTVGGATSCAKKASPHSRLYRDRCGEMLLRSGSGCASLLGRSVDLADALFDLVGSEITKGLDRCTLHGDEEAHRDALHPEDIS